MFVFATILLLFSEVAVHGTESGFMRFYNEYINFSGFELWKFLNLAIFVAIFVYIAKKPLGAAFKAKREVIRAELIRAEEARKAALAQLTAAEAKLAQLDTEKQNILSRAKAEAETDAKRITESTELEAERLRKQGEADLARIETLRRLELRRFSAEESIRIAEAKLRSQIDAGIDSRLVTANIQELGGLN
jgi:F-type H+-transporting ATPase subunit b